MSMDISNQPTLVHILKQRAQVTPDRTACVFLQDGETRETSLTYRQLDLYARRIAGHIQEMNPRAEDSRVLLIYPQGIEFLTAFFGSLYAGATAVLVYPPTSKKMAKRLGGIARDCDVSLVLSTAGTMANTPALAAGSDAAIAGLPWLATDHLDERLETRFVEQHITGDHLAFLQYTSGSTGTPKGVMVSHDNLIANQKVIRAAFGGSEESTSVSWLPLIHDMGLIGNPLRQVFLGGSLVLMSPLQFIQKPLRWLAAISKYRADLSGGPNFAYELCVNRIHDRDLAGLDLSCWKHAYSGAEPVRKETVTRFYRRFAVCGLRPAAHKASYGLAEATLLVTCDSSGHSEADFSTGCMPCGSSQPDHTVKIVDPETSSEVAEGEQGEIWVHGPSVARGYWNQPEATEQTFKARLPGSDLDFLRTGDIGYSRDGQLYVSGRRKDIIIVQGKNYCAEDLEWSVNEVQGIRPGCVAAFSIERDGREQPVLLAGLTAVDEAAPARIAAHMRAAIHADHQLHVERIVFIDPKELPTTTSGKVQRQLSRRMFLDGELTVLSEHVVPPNGVAANAGARRAASFVAPSTDAERELAAIWGEVLELPKDRIGIHDNFFELGGTSLAVHELARRLKLDVGAKLFRQPTISAYLYGTSEYEYPNVAEDIWLPPMAIDETLEGRTGLSLITGGAGLFGVHFLAAMMKRSDDRFVLLIRGEDEATIRRKLEEAISRFRLEDAIDRSRLILMRGDLSQPRLGMADDEYQVLARDVDRIYHLGSHVNNWLPYEGIRAINVEGTRSMLELARTGRKKELHYASTSTFTPRKEDKSVFAEGDSIDHTDINRYFGYDISKYVSEELCKLARREGLTCSIYRLVWVGGQMDTGIAKINDGFNIMLRILITLGVYPQGDYRHDIIPVDVMADAMASLQGKARNLDFNVTSQSKESIDMRRIAAMLRGMGYKLEEVSRAELAERLKSHPLESWDEHCKSYRQLIIRLFEDPTPPLESFYDSTNFRELMDPLVAARMEQKFIDTWFERTVTFFVQNGALPSPSGRSYNDDLAYIAQWNRTDAPFPHDACLHRLFEQRAAATPDAVALRFEGEEITYRDLDRRANAIAHLLGARGVQPRRLVGLSLSRSPALIASILGILKAGCAYVPLDPSYPAASLDFMIDDSGASLIVADTAAASRLARHGEKLVVAGAAPREPADGDAEAPAGVAVTSSDLAYVIYTSGTTGKPKGVQVEHRSVVNHNMSIQRAFALTPADKVLQFSTVNFDTFVEEVFPTLLKGATVVLAREGDITDIQRLATIIKESSVSVLMLSTAYFHATCDLDVAGLGVRLVVIGGEAADLNKYRTFRAKNPTIPLINAYGPTEATVTATLAVMNGREARLTIGKPLANVRAHVLDAWLNPLPIGFIGELYIGGAGVTRGYLNRAEESARSFLESPFVAGERMYKTGDLVRWTKDGELEYMGRADRQVKVRGFRIELEAIESALSTHPEVQGAAVVVKQVETRSKIVAYFSARAPGLEGEGLRSYLEQRLPGYMMPNLLIRLPQIPLLPNAKVDRRALEELEISAAKNVDFVSPETSSQKKMARIWEQVLNVEDVGLNDEFLALGGHSLLAMSLLKEINAAFAVKLPISALYQHATIGKLLDHIEGSAGAAASNLIRFPENDAVDEKAKLRPLFMVHGLGGHLASFYPLVRNLKKTLLDKHGLDITVYGLQASGLEEGQPCFASLDEMVSRYVRLVLETQPRGPYLIGGWSYGVFVALHVAEELILRGEEVEMFIAIDAGARQIPEDLGAFMQASSIMSADDLYDDDALERLIHKYGDRFGLPANSQESPRRKLHRFLGYTAGESDVMVERYSRVAVSNLFNARGSRPIRIRPRHAVLVRASSSHHDDYIKGWSEVVDSTVLHSVTLPGDHWSVMQDPALSAMLAKFIATFVAA